MNDDLHSMLAKIFRTSIVLRDRIIFKTEIKDTIKIIKEFYNYDAFKDIIAVQKENGFIELTYRMYSTDNQDTFVGSFLIKDRACSIKDLYEKATLFEKKISNEFNIIFFD